MYISCSKGESSFTEISLSAGGHQGSGLMGSVMKKGMRADDGDEGDGEDEDGDGDGDGDDDGYGEIFLLIIHSEERQVWWISRKMKIRGY